MYDINQPFILSLTFLLLSPVTVHSHFKSIPTIDLLPSLLYNNTVRARPTLHHQGSTKMHELGVVFSIIKTIEEVAAENGVTEVSCVALELGEVSAVVPDLLADCWDWAVKRTDILKEAALEIETIPAVTFCEDCRREYPTVEHGKICPHCGSKNTFLLQGNEFSIKHIRAI